MDQPRTLSSIRALHWQPRLGAPGQLVESWGDIDQAIRVILLTPLGSDRHRPDFGWDGHSYLDWPVNRVTPHLVRAAIMAINRWEPRVKVSKIDVAVDGAHITLRVVWEATDGVQQQTEVVYERTAA